MRSSEIVAVRFAGVDRKRQVVEVRFGQRLASAPRRPPRPASGWSTSPTARACSTSCAKSCAGHSARDVATTFFTDDEGHPLDQERMHRHVFVPALRRACLRHRGSHCIRDTFISQALAAGESINWAAKFCGTSATMIEKHYWKWVEGRRGDGSRFASALFGSASGPRISPGNDPARDENLVISGGEEVEAGESNTSE